MIIHGVDTSLPLLSIGLIRDTETLGAIAIEGKGSRNEKLLPAIDWLLSESGVDRHAIDLYAVTRGPGSFTGVRIGLATVQGMALALGKPVCAMSTHEAIALGEGSGPGLLPHLETIAVIDAAGRGEWYLSLFAGHAESASARLATAEERSAIADTVALTIDTADFLQHGNVAAACGRRAHEIAAAGRLDRYTDVTPIYVRLAEAEARLQSKTDG